MVEKYLKAGKFLNHRDNNGHTPQEMAHFEGYTEAIILFNSYKKKKQSFVKRRNN